MKVVFMGTPDFAVPALDALIDLGTDVLAVYTRAPRPAGRRGLELTKTPVHARADALGLRVLTPATLRAVEAQEEFVSFAADAAIVAAYGLILPVPVLAAPKLGCLNLHGSLLPRWRGAAPIQRAIMSGDAETGVALMRMEEGLDTGAVAREARIPIRPEDIAGELTRALAELGARLMSECWSDFSRGNLAFHPQGTDGVVYARKIDKRETPIDWTRDATAVRNHIHGLSPSPGAHSEIPRSGAPDRIKFLRADLVEGSGAPGAVLDEYMTIACGCGAIRAREAQRSGKTPMSGAEIMRGGKIRVGDRFTPAAELRSDRRVGV